MNLLLLTKSYPYGTQETFLENEIRTLSKYFVKIYIIACEVPKIEKTTRQIPDNVVVYCLLRKSKIRDVVFSLKNIVRKKTDFTDELKNAYSLTSKLFLCYFEEKSQRIYKTILRNHLLNNLKGAFVLYSYWLFTTARVGTLISEKMKPICAFSRAHRYDLYEERNKTKYLPYRRLFLKTFDYIFPCSEDGTAYLNLHYPDNTQNVITSYLGTLDHGIGTESSDEIFRIVSCSRVVPVKRVERIIDVLYYLDHENLKIEWTHIGGGSELKRIQKRVANTLCNITCYFTGDIKNEDVINWYIENPVDLFLNVSSSEGLPVSIMEAISFGVPVIATNVGGTSEIVVSGVTGELIPRNFSDEALAKIIKKYMLMKNKSEIRKSCRKFWEEHFQATVNYCKLYDYIDQMCKSKYYNLRDDS